MNRGNLALIAIVSVTISVIISISLYVTPADPGSRTTTATRPLFHLNLGDKDADSRLKEAVAAGYRIMVSGRYDIILVRPDMVDKVIHTGPRGN
jgi:hypothetical protein